jgi:dolichyl-phosphate beta-glucosyltransferase
MNNECIVVIPCYNEANRLQTEQYLESLKKLPNLSVLFVNDGSKDKTLQVIDSLAGQLPEQISVLDAPENGGKAQAIFLGMNEALPKNPKYLGYIDADLAVSLEEFNAILEVAQTEKKKFVFGSRWKRIGSVIERKITRHYIGRVFATLFSNLLQLDIYDTQCGAKVMDCTTAQHVFKNKFNVNWIFDVEIFFRLLQVIPKEKFSESVLEYPLKEWRDVEGSKVKISHFITILRDVLVLKKRYGKGN